MQYSYFVEMCFLFEFGVEKYCNFGIDDNFKHSRGRTFGTKLLHIIIYTAQVSVWRNIHNYGFDGNRYNLNLPYSPNHHLGELSYFVCIIQHKHVCILRAHSQANMKKYCLCPIIWSRLLK